MSATQPTTNEKMRSSISISNAVRSFNNKIDDCGPWANAIEEATTYAFAIDKYEQQRRRQSDENRYFSISTEEGIHRVDRSLVFLEEVQSLLEQQKHKECAPVNPLYPPSFLDEDRREDIPTSGRGDNPLSRTIASNAKSNSSSSLSIEKVATKKIKRNQKNVSKKKSKRRTKTSTSNNRYAVIATDSDDGSDNDEGKNDRTSPIDRGGSSKPRAARGGATNGMTIKKSLSAEADPYVPIFYLPSFSFVEDGDDRGILQQPHHQARNQEEPLHQAHHMDTMRLLIRLHSSQSDLHAKKARLLAAQRKWLLGAGSLQSSIAALSKGLGLADTAISAINVATYSDTAHSTGWADVSSPQEIMASDKVPTIDDGVPSIIAVAEFTDHRRAQLQKDAEIASVSTHCLIAEKARYIQSAHAQVAKLQRILQPLWRSRDAAKKRIGDAKWKSKKKVNQGNNKSNRANKNPKKIEKSSTESSYTKIRRRHEDELWEIEEALRQLEFSEAATSTLVEEADKLREKLKQLRFAKNRYNGRQPTTRRLLQVKMDPKIGEPSHLEHLVEEYGWTFTGSIDGVDCVQFFEKWVNAGPQLGPPSIPRIISVPNWNIEGDDTTNPNSGSFNVLVKLDYYYMTGAVQTVVEYPTRYNEEGAVVQNAWSSTLDFNVDKDDINSKAVYRQILMNPLMTHRLHGGTNVALQYS